MGALLSRIVSYFICGDAESNCDYLFSLLLGKIIIYMFLSLFVIFFRFKYLLI